METLDKCFENVCELDLIFHMDKVSQEQKFTYEIYQYCYFVNLKEITDRS